MKRIHLHCHLAFLLGMLLCSGLPAQLCTVSSTDTIRVVLPSDTLEIDGSVLSSQVLQVVVPGDTVLFGFTVIYDSSKVTNITGLLNGLQSECHTASPRCTAYPDSSGFLRYCLRISNTQIMGYSPSYPNYQVMRVAMELGVTIGFPTYQFVPDTLEIYYRVHNADSIVPVGLSAKDIGELRVTPNPANSACHLDYQLTAANPVTLCVTDAIGRLVFATLGEVQQAGRHSLALDMDTWPSGVYFVNLQIGTLAWTRKLIKLQ